MSLLVIAGCTPGHPPEDAHRFARKGEPCFAPPRPWEDPVGPFFGQNVSNLPQCPARFPPNRAAPFQLRDEGP